MMKVMLDKMNLMLMMARLLQLTTLPEKTGRTTLDILLRLKDMMLIAEQNGETQDNDLAAVVYMNIEERAKDIAAASEEALPFWRKKRA